MRLPYLDGVRGFAALYVFGYHSIMVFTIETEALRSTWSAGLLSAHNIAYYAFLNWGHYAVCIFIVLSGFCLMLPVVQDTEHRLRGGLVGYFTRRARRILPAYYGALAVSIVVKWLVPARSGTAWMWPASVDWVEVPSRLLLVHNIITDHWKINPPMWTVALEFQIYILMPLVLLPAWRRYRGSGLLAAASAVALPPLLISEQSEISWRNSQMVILFALGMQAAAIVGGFEERHVRIRSWRWDHISLVSTLTVLVMCSFQRRSIIESSIGQYLNLD